MLPPNDCAPNRHCRSVTVAGDPRRRGRYQRCENGGSAKSPPLSPSTVILRLDRRIVLNFVQRHPMVRSSRTMTVVGHAKTLRRHMARSFMRGRGAERRFRTLNSAPCGAPLRRFFSFQSLALRFERPQKRPRVILPVTPCCRIGLPRLAEPPLLKADSQRRTLLSKGRAKLSKASCPA